MSRLGLNAKCYRNSGTYASPTWVEMKNIVDLTVGDEMESADVTSRASGGYAESEPTIRSIDLEFQMVNKAADADMLAIRAAYAARSSLDIVAMDGEIATAGSHGVRARYKVHSFKKGQNLKEAQMIDVVLKPASDTNPPSEMTIS